MIRAESAARQADTPRTSMCVYDRKRAMALTKCSALGCKRRHFHQPDYASPLFFDLSQALRYSLLRAHWITTSQMPPPNRWALKRVAI